MHYGVYELIKQIELDYYRLWQQVALHVATPRNALNPTEFRVS